MAAAVDSSVANMTVRLLADRDDMTAGDHRTWANVSQGAANDFRDLVQAKLVRMVRPTTHLPRPSNAAMVTLARGRGRGRFVHVDAERRGLAQTGHLVVFLPYTEEEEVNFDGAAGAPAWLADTGGRGRK